MDSAVRATSAQAHRLSLERIAHASSVIDPVFLDTPQFESESLGRQLGCRLVVKVETLNPIGSFKARGAPATQRAWQEGRVVSLTHSRTIADGLSVQTPFAESVADLATLADDILLVEDETLIAAMRLAHREQFREKVVATVLTGGNLTPEQMRQWLPNG